MKKWLLLLLLTAPCWLMSQEIKNGTITFDFGKKKNKQPVDTTAQKPVENTEEGAATKTRKEKKAADTVQHARRTFVPYDPKKEGIFFGLFHAGVNACQVDGDYEWGYKYLGAEAGIGALARFHKIFSVSLELNYTMKGARTRIAPTPDNNNRYVVQWDYVEAPIALNAHYKRLFIVSIGVAPAVMTRYKEIDMDGLNITANPIPLGKPRKIDVCGFASLHFIIKDHYAIGAKFAYSMLKIRGAFSGTKVNGEYNNYLTLRFMYILGRVKTKGI